jgi:hypothetical protein
VVVNAFSKTFVFNGMDISSKAAFEADLKRRVFAHLQGIKATANPDPAADVTALLNSSQALDVEDA